MATDQLYQLNLRGVLGVLCGGSQLVGGFESCRCDQRDRKLQMGSKQLFHATCLTVDALSLREQVDGWKPSSIIVFHMAAIRELHGGDVVTEAHDITGSHCSRMCEDFSVGPIQHRAYAFPKAATFALHRGPFRPGLCIILAFRLQTTSQITIV